MTNREIKTILFGFSTILFFSLYYNISNSTEESTTADNIQAVVSLITLIVSIITIYFVYKAYLSQKEQIELQQNELESNRKDVEFNRAVDLFYKQIEFTKNRILIINNLEPIIYDFIHITNYINDPYYNVNFTKYQLETYSKLMDVLFEDFTSYDKVLKILILDNDSKKLLLELMVNNIYPKLYESIYNFRFLLHDLNRNFSIKADNGEKFEKVVYLDNINFYFTKVSEILFLESSKEIKAFLNEELET